jgi:hypothetical protein
MTEQISAQHHNAIRLVLDKAASVDEGLNCLKLQYLFFADVDCNY